MKITDAASLRGWSLFKRTAAKKYRFRSSLKGRSFPRNCIVCAILFPPCPREERRLGPSDRGHHTNPPCRSSVACVSRTFSSPASGFNRPLGERFIRLRSKAPIARSKGAPRVSGTELFSACCTAPMSGGVGRGWRKAEGCRGFTSDKSRVPWLAKARAP